MKNKLKIIFLALLFLQSCYDHPNLNSSNANYEPTATNANSVVADNNSIKQLIEDLGNPDGSVRVNAYNHLIGVLGT